MAHRLIWRLAAAASFLAVLLLAHTTDFGVRRGGGATAEQRQYHELSVSLERALNRYREYARVAWVQQLLPDTFGVVLDMPESMRSTDLPVRGALALELAGVDTVRARVAVLILSDTVGAFDPPGRPTSFARANEREIHAGTDEAGPYCAAVSIQRRGGGTAAEAFAVRQDRYATAQQLSVLGPCYYWARYGAPGPHIAEWLRQGGYRFAEQRYSQPLPRGMNSSRAALFGSTFNMPGELGAGAGRACRAGREDRCLQGLLHADTTNMITSGVYNPSRYFTFGPVERALLADLERQRGPERFGDFWRSGEEVAAAFEASFGMELPGWIASWVDTRHPETVSTPRMSISTVLLALFTLAVFLATAMASGARRQIR